MTGERQGSSSEYVSKGSRISTSPPSLPHQPTLDLLHGRTSACLLSLLRLSTASYPAPEISCKLPDSTWSTSHPSRRLYPCRTLTHVRVLSTHACRLQRRHPRTTHLSLKYQNIRFFVPRNISSYTHKLPTYFSPLYLYAILLNQSPLITTQSSNVSTTSPPWSDSCSSHHHNATNNNNNIRHPKIGVTITSGTGTWRGTAALLVGGPHQARTPAPHSPTGTRETSRAEANSATTSSAMSTNPPSQVHATHHTTPPNTPPPPRRIPPTDTPSRALLWVEDLVSGDSHTTTTANEPNQPTPTRTMGPPPDPPTSPDNTPGPALVREGYTTRSGELWCDLDTY
ncbi:hypothetical protein Pcinc_009845 [Petrolisthes cinctipes]|uniref:Uncharacterized protein n=1 Tax=Petrolisthes cinctipes TaxID=88211 RepID=A0AAE1G5Z8_PETCI|nr:hypothetical protein Pcinc_009845 [Petrolisthes cinctipes]